MIHRCKILWAVAVQTGCIAGVRKRTGKAVLCTGHLQVTEGYIFSKGQSERPDSVYFLALSVVILHPCIWPSLPK